jgi:hypothetical protein
VRPDSKARPEYVAAFREIAARIEASIAGLPAAALPIKMYVAGGAALHFYTGERVSRDIDAVFSRRIALPDQLEVSYRGADGTGQLLYFDHNYNDTLALMHQDAQEDSVPLALTGLDSRKLDVRLLSPLDLAVSKLSRFSDQDRDDIVTLARRKLIKAAALRTRAEQALGGYVGNVDRIRGNIVQASRIVEDTERRHSR